MPTNQTTHSGAQDDATYPAEIAANAPIETLSQHLPNEFEFPFEQHTVRIRSDINPRRAAVSPNETVDNGSPDDLEWTVEYLYERLFAIGWVLSIFDEVAQDLCRRGDTVPKGRKNVEDTRCERE